MVLVMVLDGSYAVLLSCSCAVLLSCILRGVLVASFAQFSLLVFILHV